MSPPSVSSGSGAIPVPGAGAGGPEPVDADPSRAHLRPEHPHACRDSSRRCADCHGGCRRRGGTRAACPNGRRLPRAAGDEHGVGNDAGRAAVTTSSSQHPAKTIWGPSRLVRGVRRPTRSSTRARVPSRSPGSSSPLCRAPPSRSRPRCASTVSSIRSAINRLVSPPASPDADQVYGGGLIFPCASDKARARLTDVSVWEDGYNADPVIADETFDPGDDWHTYRFELRGDQLRLLVDGADVVYRNAGGADRPAVSATRKPGSGRRACSSKCGRCRFSCFPLPERIRRAGARPRDPSAAR